MADPDRVSAHYTHGSLLAAIRAGLARLGKTPESVTVHDLGPVEEFHIGGRAASQSFLDQLDLSAADHVLDVGCGLGGSSRFVAEHYGCRVTGIDLTPEYIATGRELCAWVGLGSRITLDQGSATDLPYPGGGEVVLTGQVVRCSFARRTSLTPSPQPLSREGRGARSVMTPR